MRLGGVPFLKASGNVYVGNPETCRRFLSALVWMTKEGATWRGWFRKSVAIGIVSIAASVDGAMPVSLKNFMNISMMRVKSLRASLIRRSCGHIHLRQGSPKKTADRFPRKHSVGVMVALRRNSMLR